MSWKRQKYLLSFWNISRSKICYCRLCNKILLQRKFTKIFFLFCCPKAHLDVVSSSDLRVYSQHCLPSIWSGTKVGGSCQQYLARAEEITYFFSIWWLSPPRLWLLTPPSLWLSDLVFCLRKSRKPGSGTSPLRQAFDTPYHYNTPTFTSLNPYHHDL